MVVLWTVVVLATTLGSSCHGWLQPKIPIVSSSPKQGTVITGSNLGQVQVRNDPRDDDELFYDQSIRGQIRHATMQQSTSVLLGWLLAMGFWTVASPTAATAMDYSTTNTNQNHHHPNDNIRTSTGNPYYEWELLNGSVKLPDPIRLNYRDRKTGVEKAIILTKPELVGAGGGGAVFAFDVISKSNTDDAPPDEQLLLKVSWEGTRKTVQRECATLQLLEDRQVQAAERCFGTFPYPEHESSKSTAPERTMILVSPYVRHAVASLTEVEDPKARVVAVDQIARNLVQMLAAHVITIDVQPLISKSTGHTIFIDLTEAQTLSSSSSSEPRTTSMLQQTLISSYISEMVALIPSQYWKVAQVSIANELEFIHHRQPNGPDLATSLRSLLEQTPFFDD